MNPSEMHISPRDGEVSDYSVPSTVCPKGGSLELTPVDKLPADTLLPEVLSELRKVDGVVRLGYSGNTITVDIPETQPNSVMQEVISIIAEHFGVRPNNVWYEAVDFLDELPER